MKIAEEVDYCISSAESEYVALRYYAKNILCKRKFYWEMVKKKTWPQNGCDLNPTTFSLKPTTVILNSTAATALASNKQVSASNKHINSKYLFVSAAIGSDTMVLNFLASAENPWYMLT